MGFIRTFLLGGAIGAGLAVLLAPRTGTETQAQLRDRVKGLRDQYGDVIEQGRLRATELIQSGREMLDQGQTMVNTAMERSRPSSAGGQTPTDQGTRQEEQVQPPHQQL
jgi:gas vesicle protein